MEARTAEVMGIDMRWLEAGEGLPVVLLHGIPTSPALWRHVVPRLTGVRCLAFELVGHGDSIAAGRGREIGVAAQADYVAAWLDHLGLDAVVLAGHDLGGGVAQLAAACYPGLCAGLFLTNSIAYDNWPVPSVAAMRATRLGVRFTPNAAFKQVLRTFFLKGHLTWAEAEEGLAAHWPAYGRSGGAAAFARQIAALRTRDTLAIADELPGLGVPARIAWGAADTFLKVKYGERLAQDLSAPLRRIEGGRHFTPEDHPEIIAQEIEALVETVREARERRKAA